MENKNRDQQSDWQNTDKQQASNNNNDNTSAQDNRQQEGVSKTKRNTTMAAGNIGRSATAQVDPHSNSGLAQTGTNISYEGPTAPGGGGSAGTGYTSGKSGVDPTITTNSDYTQGEVGKHRDKTEGEDNITDSKSGTADVSE